jgi:lipopolysaccharide transport protein LptA
MLLARGWLATAQSPPPQPIVIDAAYSYVDYQTNSVRFRTVAVSQGDTRVTAERAYSSGVGFANSQWTFDGNVVFVLEPRGTLRADRAIVQFRDNRIAEATATGSPALFDQRHDDPRGVVRGQAQRIAYDASRGSVRLTGDARVSDGDTAEISGPALIYDIRGERLQAASPGAARGVHITIHPRLAP